MEKLSVSPADRVPLRRKGRLVHTCMIRGFQYPLRIVYPCDYYRKEISFSNIVKAFSIPCGSCTPATDVKGSIFGFPWNFQYPLRIVYPCDVAETGDIVTVHMPFQYPLRIVYPCDSERFVTDVTRGGAFSIPCGSCTPATWTRMNCSPVPVSLSVSPADRVPLRHPIVWGYVVGLCAFSIPCGSCTPATRIRVY